MKRLLLVAATAAEIGPFLEHLAPFAWGEKAGFYRLQDREIQVCITGVGMMQTAFRLGRILVAGNVDLAVQAGIAGSFDPTLALGSLAVVTSEVQGDLGAEDREQYLDIFNLGFADKNSFPFTNGRLLNPSIPAWAQYLPQLSSLSVNTVSGHEPTIQARSRRFGCSLESMEGAAFHYACLSEGIPFLQLRSLSNYVEPRNRNSWQIGTALNTLNDFLIRNLGAGAQDPFTDTPL